MTRWYADYFTADYWSFARHEYTEERTAGEVAYLVKTLEAHAPGRRVLDLGCGVGRHAVPLAAHGFEVTCVDVCRWALDRAGEAARRARVPLALVHADLLAGAGLPEADAAICLQSFGWGRDDEQRALLRRVRDRLVPGGLLVLDHSNAGAILARYEPTARFEAEDTVFDFLRTYDPVTGRSRGELRVAHPGGRTTVLRDDVRLYQPPEVAGMLGEAGYDILRADADFVIGAEIRAAATRYVQFVARARPVPEPAVLDYARPAPAPGSVDLRWAPDEVEHVRDVIGAAWAEVTAPGRELADLARDYAVGDPYGGERSAPVLARHFGTAITPGRVVTGAGTTGLLHALSTLAATGTVLCAPYAHPDLPGWAARLGSALRPYDPADDGAPALIEATRPALVLLERPGVRGDLLPLDRVRALAEAARGAGGLLVVDEACAAYAGPAASAVPLTSETGGLVVLRGVSKGYCCGGLRAGFGVASADVADDVREVAAPLAVSALSLEVALRLLDRGDVFARLRAAVAAAKPELVDGLSRLGHAAEPGHPALPWVTVRGEGPPGIWGKSLRPVFGEPLTRISVPLSAARMDAFRSVAGR